MFNFGWTISLSNTTGMMLMIPRVMGKNCCGKKKKKAEMETSQVSMSPERDISHCFMYPDRGTWQSYFPHFSPNNPFLHSLKHLLSSIILLSLFHLLSWNKWKKDSMIYSSLCLIHSWRFIFYLSDKSIWLSQRIQNQQSIRLMDVPLIIFLFQCDLMLKCLTWMTEWWQQGFLVCLFGSVEITLKWGEQKG